ncbi:MAG: lipase family protein [Gammaproteobacteria bacterium]|nr:lipase family protein [Gammaproteobacteria bacterium]
MNSIAGPISDHLGSKLDLRSRLSGPIETLGKLPKSLLFAELSMLAYLPEHDAGLAAVEIGFADIRYLDRDGSQAYVFSNQTDCVVACRGTEPNEWNDIKADANAMTALAETVGHVHRSFKREVDDLWPHIEEALVTNSKTLWFTGHSLGGAMATICAGRRMLSTISSNPRELYTFGSPRVGNKRYINHCKVDYTRWVNNNDIVTRVPPAWLEYRHTGREVYIDARGRIRALTDRRRTRDRWLGFVRALRRGKLDHFDDHSIHRYLECIRLAVEQDK